MSKHRRVSLVLLLCIAVAGCAVVHASGQSPVSTRAVDARSSTPVATARSGPSKVLDWRAAQKDIPSFPECLGRPLDHCIVVHGSGTRVLLMGDSLARMWLPAFTAIAHRRSLNLAVAIYPACPWPEDLSGLGISPGCQTSREDWYKRIIPAFAPAIVFLANRPYDAPGNELTLTVSGHVRSARDPIAVRAISASMRRSIARLRGGGRKLVLLEPTPLPVHRAYDPMSCVATGRRDCTFTVSPLVTPLTQFDRTLAQAADVWSLDLNRLVCPRFPVCDAIVRGLIVRRDHTHLTATYARALADPLDALLRGRHIL